MSKILSVNNLTKVYSSGKGVRNITFDLEKGTILGVIGLNGAGKTTLMSCLTGFLDHGSGSREYHFDDKVYNNVAPAVLENLGIVTTEYDFPGHFNAKIINNIMAAGYKNWSRSKFYETLELLELDIKLKTAKYSTGMKAKLAIAMALSHSPKILIFDEATNGLDVKASAKVRQLLHDFVAGGENSIILTSHIMGEIERMSDSIMLLHNGNMKFICNRDDLLHQYKVFPVSSKRLDSIDMADVLVIKQDGFATRVIAKDPKAFAEKYVIEPVTLSLGAVMEILLEGNDVV